MRVSEWIICGFFAYLVILARAFPLSGRRRARVVLVALVCVGLTVVLSQLRLQTPMRIARDWVPALLLLQGYWLSGLFFSRPMLRIENRLLRLDRRLFTIAHLSAAIRRAPRILLELLELAYLGAYPFVPITFGIVYAAGSQDGIDRFWTAVLIASFGCYGMLPWVQTRPPRALERDSAIDARALTMRSVNLQLLAHASIQVNTVPSGHAATALAAALVTGEFVPASLPILLGTALAIAVTTVVGRYHYAVDTLLGLGMGLAGWWAARLLAS